MPVDGIILAPRRTVKDTRQGNLSRTSVKDMYILRAGPAVKLTFRVPAIKLEPLGAQCY